uniref:Uncharacterized protein n=1 Tax=Pyricularia oryzae (strain P131) TaxID=1143193 RepID=L7J530_PYRO1
MPANGRGGSRLLPKQKSQTGRRVTPESQAKVPVRPQMSSGLKREAISLGEEILTPYTRQARAGKKLKGFEIIRVRTGSGNYYCHNRRQIQATSSLESTT